MNMDLVSGTLVSGSVAKVRRVNQWEWQAVLADIANKHKWQELDGEHHLVDKYSSLRLVTMAMRWWVWITSPVMA